MAKCIICKKKAKYAAKKGDKPKFCKDHKGDKMFDVTKKLCEDPECTTRPSYGKEWQKPTHCKKHALPDIKNVVSKRCEDPKCTTRASYGKEWKKPTHCKEHASEDMEDVVSKRCEDPKCTTRASYGKEWKKPTHCKEHASEDMEDVRHKRCEDPKCTTRASYGKEWKKPTHCKEHALPDMEDVVNKRCEDPKCDKQPSYGKEWQKRTHCKEHASEDMKNVANKRCEYPKCDKIPCYGKEWKKPTHCKEHALPDMEDVINKRCEQEGCKIQPCHENLCFNHWVEAHKDDPDFKVKIYRLIKQKACINDFMPNVIEDSNVLCMFEETIFGDNEKRRLDCLIVDEENDILINVECDEYQHKHRKDEQKRINSISCVYTKSMFMIRFNPDDYKTNGRHVTGCWNGKKEDGCPCVPECQKDNWKHRLEVLEETVKLCISGKPFEYFEKEFENNDEKQTERFKNILIIKLFYDKK
jgi:hypothetical protein